MTDSGHVDPALVHLVLEGEIEEMTTVRQKPWEALSSQATQILRSHGLWDAALLRDAQYRRQQSFTASSPAISIFFRIPFTSAEIFDDRHRAPRSLSSYAGIVRCDAFKRGFKIEDSGRALSVLLAGNWGKPFTKAGNRARHRGSTIGSYQEHRLL